jgi:hypothetical protein
MHMRRALSTLSGQTQHLDQHYPKVGRSKEPMMDETSRDVLAAADSWLTAIQAMAAADEAQRRTKDQQLDLDDAEVVLAAAVLAWRDAGPDQKRLRCLSIGRWAG